MRRTLAAIALVGLVVACSGDASVSKDGASSTAATSVTVMTRNLYLGADLEPIFTATPDTLVGSVQAAYQQMLDSEVAARLDLVADEISNSRPDLVALQEASEWTAKAPDAAAPTTIFDFVAILLDRLSAKGVDYEVAATSNGFSGGLPVSGVGAVSMQDRDVILHRTDSIVTVANPASGQYEHKLTVSVVGAPIDVLRGWASVDASVSGRTFRFVGTHLEAYDDAVRDAQEQELLVLVGASTTPVMVLGDLNSAAGASNSKAYDTLLAAGFVDAWTSAHAAGPGLTCCRSADLRSGSVTERIDYVVTKGGLAAEHAQVLGGDDSPRTPGGRWPSDHAGVVARFAF